MKKFSIVITASLESSIITSKITNLAVREPGKLHPTRGNRKNEKYLEDRGVSPLGLDQGVFTETGCKLDLRDISKRWGDGGAVPNAKSDVN